MEGQVKSDAPIDVPLAMPRVPDDLVIPRTGLEVPDHLLPALLRPGEKRVLDILADWPWITTNDLGGMLGVSRMRVSVVAHFEVGCQKRR